MPDRKARGNRPATSSRAGVGVPEYVRVLLRSPNPTLERQGQSVLYSDRTAPRPCAPFEKSEGLDAHYTATANAAALGGHRVGRLSLRSDPFRAGG